MKLIIAEINPDSMWVVLDQDQNELTTWERYGSDMTVIREGEAETVRITYLDETLDVPLVLTGWLGKGHYVHIDKLKINQDLK